MNHLTSVFVCSFRWGAPLVRSSVVVASCLVKCAAALEQNHRHREAETNSLGPFWAHEDSRALLSLATDDESISSSSSVASRSPRDLADAIRTLSMQSRRPRNARHAKPAPTATGWAAVAVIALGRRRRRLALLVELSSLGPFLTLGSLEQVSA